MQKIFLMAAVILLFAVGARAQDTPASEVSASYSLLRFGVSHGVNQNGATFNTYTYMGGRDSPIAIPVA